MDVSDTQFQHFCLIQQKSFLILQCTGPQLVVSLYGINYWGAEVSKGYVRIHIPINNKADQRAPIMTAKCSNIWSTISNCFLDRNPELKDPRVLTESEKLKEFHMETHGELAFSIQTILSSHSLDQ